MYRYTSQPSMIIVIFQSYKIYKHSRAPASLINQRNQIKFEIQYVYCFKVLNVFN